MSRSGFFTQPIRYLLTRSYGAARAAFAASSTARQTPCKITLQDRPAGSPPRSITLVECSYDFADSEIVSVDRIEIPPRLKRDPRDSSLLDSFICRMLLDSVVLSLTLSIPHGKSHRSGVLCLGNEKTLSKTRDLVARTSTQKWVQI